MIAQFRHRFLVILSLTVMSASIGCEGGSPPASSSTAQTGQNETKPTTGDDTAAASAQGTYDEPGTKSAALETPVSTDPDSNEGPALIGPTAETESASESSTASKPDSKDFDLQLKDLEGLQELIAEHKGKVVVVDYWSSWCPPCIREFPHLVHLQKQLGEDVVCISACCNYDGLPDEPPESFRKDVQAFLKEHDADILNVIMTVDTTALFKQLNLASIPAVYVYNRDGELAKRFDNEDPDKLKADGEFTYEKDITPLVTELLKAEPAPESK
ncbi:MAG: TlpA family protein disulfide reductase [Planctomycetaceae bacterium]